MMLNLVIKDFRASGFYLPLLLVVLAAVTVAFTLALRSGDSVESELYVMIVLLSAMISSKLFILLEMENKTDHLFAGLPVTRRQLVVAKYLSSTLMILLVLAVHLLAIHFSATKEMRGENYLMFYPEMWILCGLVITLSDAFSFPFYFKFGVIKGAFMYGGTMIFLSLLTVFILGQINRSIWFHELVRRVLDQPVWALTFELIVLFILIIYGSILVSINIFKYKDL